MALYRRCCMDRVSAEFPQTAGDLRCDVETADGIWASRVQHAVEDGHTDSRFGLLTVEASRSQARTDDGLVSAHRGFNQEPAIVGAPA